MKQSESNTSPSGQAAAPIAAGSGGAEATHSAGIPDALMSQLSALIDQKITAASALRSMPAPTVGQPRARANAPVGHGTLQQLRLSAGLTADTKDEAPAEDADAAEESELAGEDANPFASLAAPAPSKSALDGRLAAELWADIKPYGTAISFVKMYHWNNARNSHEAESIAWALDAFVKENVALNSLGFEIMIRRLFGVRLADETKNWDMAKSISWKNDSLLSRGLLRHVLKDAKTLGELSKSTAVSVTPKKTFGASGKGKSKQQTFGKNNKAQSSSGKTATDK